MIGCWMLGSSSMVLISVHCWGSRPWPGVNFIFGLFIEFPLSLPEMGPDQARFLAMGSLSQMRPNAREAAPILVELLAERRKKRPDFFAPLRLRCSSRATELPVIPSCRSLAGGSAPNGRSASSGSKTPWPGTASGPGPISASESGNSINKPKIKFTPGHGLLLQQ